MKSVQAKHVKVGVFVCVVAAGGARSGVVVDDSDDNNNNNNNAVEWHRVTRVDKHVVASSLMTIHTLAKNVVVNGVVASCFEKVVICRCNFRDRASL